MQEDLSRKTVIVLVILVALVSFLGTWTVLTEVNKLTAQQKHTTTATVKLNIQPPIGKLGATQNKPLNVQPKATGMATFEIIKPPQN